MRVVFLHTDFRIYWPARLNALRTFLEEKGIELRVVEMAGQGSPYQFAVGPDRPDWWDCLFPEAKMETLDLKMVRRAIIAKLDQLQPDVVLAGAIAFPSGANAVYWANRNKKKVIIFDDARLQDVPRSKMVDCIKKNIYSAVDAVFCPAPAWDATFDYFGFKKAHLFYGVNVVDNSFWQANEDETSTNQIGLPSSYILSVGRQIPKKNFLTLLHAYSYFRRSANDAPHLVLVGDGEQRAELEQVVEANKLDGVVFLPFQSQLDLKSIYQKAQFFVLPSLHGETWGLVVNEAMASGLPVLVSSQVGCASTLVADGVNGYVFDPGDHQELASMLELMSGISDHDRSAMGIRSEEIISQWGLDRFCMGVDSALQFVANSRKRTAQPLAKVFLRFWLGRYRPV